MRGNCWRNTGFLGEGLGSLNHTTSTELSIRQFIMKWHSAAVALLSLRNFQAEAQQIPLRAEDKRPNIVFILTDDQDVHLSSLYYMPLVRKHILEKGTYFNKHYCTTAVCCPSRATLWTGKAAHNTNITDVNPPYGMEVYPRLCQANSNRRVSEVCCRRIQ